MGNLIKNIQNAADGKPYVADAMKSQDREEKPSNAESQRNMMSNPRILQHSYDGEKGMSQPRTVIAEDESKA